MGKRGRPKMPPSFQEQMFQEAYGKWEASNYTDKQSWDAMFYRVHECCNAIGSKMLKGLYTSTFEDRVMDATIYIMKGIKEKHTHPSKLSSWCYWPTFNALQGKKAIKEDTELNLEDFLNTYQQSDESVESILDYL